MTKSTPTRRADYPHFLAISTRWSDNDVYGHTNNVGVLDFAEGETIGLVVETRCNFFAPVVFPEPIEAGLRV